MLRGTENKLCCCQGLGLWGQDSWSGIKLDGQQGKTMDLEPKRAGCQPQLGF